MTISYSGVGVNGSQSPHTGDGCDTDTVMNTFTRIVLPSVRLPNHTSLLLVVFHYDILCDWNFRITVRSGVDMHGRLLFRPTNLSCMRGPDEVTDGAAWPDNGCLYGTSGRKSFFPSHREPAIQ